MKYIKAHLILNGLKRYQYILTKEYNTAANSQQLECISSIPLEPSPSITLKPANNITLLVCQDEPQLRHTYQVCTQKDEEYNGKI